MASTPIKNILNFVSRFERSVKLASGGKRPKQHPSARHSDSKHKHNSDAWPMDASFISSKNFPSPEVIEPDDEFETEPEIEDDDEHEIEDDDEHDDFEDSWKGRCEHCGGYDMVSRWNPHGKPNLYCPFCDDDTVNI